MSEQMDRVTKETYRYFYVDGLAETAVGVLFAAIGLVLFGWAGFHEGSWVQKTAVIALPLLILSGAFAINHIVVALKKRITYQRTGYVAYRPGEPRYSRWLLPLLTLGLIILMFLFPAWLNKMAFIQGALLGLILTLTGYRVSLTRFYPVAVLALLIGLAAAWFVTDEVVGSALTFGLTGLAMVGSGLYAFARYLRQHPAPKES